MTQPQLSPTEQDRRSAIFDYFLIHFDIVLFWAEEYETLERDYPEEYAAFLKSTHEKNLENNRH